MSKNRNRTTLNKANDSKEYSILYLNELYPLYWEEGISMYPKYRKGFKNPNKQLFRYQQRCYRTWKYNRKKQYKNE